MHENSESEVTNKRLRVATGVKAIKKAIAVPRSLTWDVWSLASC
jgi:hypothetical protein